MYFGYKLMTDEQRDLAMFVREFLTKELGPKVKELDEKSEFPMDVYKKCGEVGLWGMDIPAEYGGVGFDPETMVILREEFGRVDAGFTVSHGCSTIGFKPVMFGGSEEQKKAYADVIMNGGISALCITEPQGGSDVAATKTKAVKDGDDYILNGTKCFITNGGISDILTVVTTTDPTKGAKGISVFIVDKNTPGVSAGKEENKMGIRLSNTTDVIFEDVRVPAKNLVGVEGKGFIYIMQQLALTRPTGMAPVVGLAQSALEYAVQYAQQRVVFGKPIIKNQGLRFMIADMEMQIQAARAFVFYNAMLVKNKIASATHASSCKAFASEMAMKVTTDAVQIMGGYGYSKDYPVEKLMRDAKVYSIFEGTNQIQRKIVADDVEKNVGLKL